MSLLPGLPGKKSQSKCVLNAILFTQEAKSCCLRPAGALSVSRKNMAWVDYIFLSFRACLESRFRRIFERFFVRCRGKKPRALVVRKAFFLWRMAENKPKRRRNGDSKQALRCKTKGMPQSLGLYSQTLWHPCFLPFYR